MTALSCARCGDTRRPDGTHEHSCRNGQCSLCCRHDDLASANKTDQPTTEENT